MQNTNSPARKKSRFVAFFLAIAIVVVAAKKFFEYSAAPASEKTSDFVYPPNADQTKPTTLVLQVAPSRQVPFEQVGGFINDASHLNKTSVYGIVKVTSVDDITNALQFARDRNLKVTAAGQRHSMGGQSLALGLDGTYYLPYQLFYSPVQLRKAYPDFDRFLAAKKLYDPSRLFTNKFYEKYGKS